MHDETMTVEAPPPEAIDQCACSDGVVFSMIDHERLCTEATAAPGDTSSEEEEVEEGAILDDVMESFQSMLTTNAMKDTVLLSPKEENDLISSQSMPLLATCSDDSDSEGMNEDDDDDKSQDVKAAALEEIEIVQSSSLLVFSSDTLSIVSSSPASSRPPPASSRSQSDSVQRYGSLETAPDSTATVTATDSWQREGELFRSSLTLTEEDEEHDHCLQLEQTEPVVVVVQEVSDAKVTDGSLDETSVAVQGVNAEYKDGDGSLEETVEPVCADPKDADGTTTQHESGQVESNAEEQAEHAVQKADADGRPQAESEQVKAKVESTTEEHALLLGGNPQEENELDDKAAGQENHELSQPPTVNQADVQNDDADRAPMPPT